jgi:trehalose transport system substrate-binding protein
MRAEEPEGYEADEHAIAEAFRQIAADVSPSPDFCTRVLKAVRQSRPTPRSWPARAWARRPKGPFMVPPRWAMASVFGLLLLWLTLSRAFAWWPFTQEVTLAVSYSGKELIGITKMGRELEDALGVTLELDHTDASTLVHYMEEMVASKTMKRWDLIIVDNDTLGLLVQKGLVDELSNHGYRPSEELIHDDLFHSLREELRVDGRDYRDYFVPFRPNVKLTYYNQETLRRAGYQQLPMTCEELRQLAEDLASRGLARVAIQAHPGKAAAATVFEFVKAAGGDPLTLADAGARQAFTCLWDLAPFLEPASPTIQFNTANEMLITDRVAMVGNWTYGIQVVMKNAGKKHIDVAREWPGSAWVLGGDMLAIPKGAPHPKRAAKLIEQLVAKSTQRKLAEHLYWAPVRADVYNELPSEEGRTKHFQVIREALQHAVMRPIIPEWALVEEVLSDALQDVLRQGRARGVRATPADIDALLRPYATRLEEIPREYMACAVVAEKTAGAGVCQVPVQQGKSFEDLAKLLARDFGVNITPAMLAKVNGRGDWEPVSPMNMKTLLVPKPVPGN